MRASAMVAAAVVLWLAWRQSQAAEISTADGEGGGMIDSAMAAYSGMLASGGNISLAGFEAIKRREGISLTTYRDSAGLPTIGYGHKLGVTEGYPSGITEADASIMLADDIGAAVGAVNALVEVSISQNQFDALVSFVFNVGAGAFRASTLLRLLNGGDYAGAAQQFNRWVYVTVGGQKEVSGGLASRRADEARQFSA